MVQRVHKVLQINSTQYACQLASATNDIKLIFTKYTIELRDCTLVKP